MIYPKTLIEAIAHHLDEFDIWFSPADDDVIVSFTAGKKQMSVAQHGNGDIKFNDETFTTTKAFVDKFEEVVGKYRRRRPFLRVEVNHDFWKELGIVILPRFVRTPIIHVSGRTSEANFIVDGYSVSIRSLPYEGNDADIVYHYNQYDTVYHRNLNAFLDLVESDLEKKLL